jgi:hypothetical protein
MYILPANINKGNNRKKSVYLRQEFCPKMIESVIREIQKMANECISRDLIAMNDSLSLKLQYFDNEQRKSFLQQELFRITDLLVQLRKNPVVDSLFEYTDNPDFLWESAFIEHLTTDGKKKYRDFNFNRNEVHDKNMPYFSQIVQFVVLSKYIKVLKKELELYQTPSPDSKKKLDSTEEKIATKKTFESNFDKQQIEILTNCINDARIFSESVTANTVSRIFKCNLNKPLRVKNNRRFAYFFASLDDRSLITHHWQSVCEANQLFLSSLKGNVLRKTDLSTATNECRDFPPKDSAIIDKYLKQLKKH